MMNRCCQPDEAHGWFARRVGGIVDEEVISSSRGAGAGMNRTVRAIGPETGCPIGQPGRGYGPRRGPTPGPVTPSAVTLGAL